jgi:hypothetical protein
MTSVPGASRYLNAATLANTRGLAAQSPTLLGSSATTLNILDAGRNALRVPGFGVSSSARSLNQQFLSNTSMMNELLSLGLGPGATAEGAAQQIRALRATLPISELHRSVLDTSALGQQVDEEA